MDLKLSTLSIVLGLLVAGPSVYGLMQPEKWAAFMRNFPRNGAIGTVLTLLATTWFIYNVSQESLSDFTRMKSLFYLLFAGVGLGTCVFVRDFLAVRGLAVLLLLLAKLMVDTARWEETGWRLVIVVWAYVLVLAGMWFTVSPWRLRDLLTWANATPQRVRAISGARLAFALLVLVLGVTVFRTTDRTPSNHTGAASVTSRG